ncbi:D-2-hydroxyacid dehydrogenase [Helicobacter saguini]|uniref:D-2-hydroxyacid dehydrogenase n=1 Tax=Helicobacter saguini TaxID=1548018 RepID=A0A347VU02_9HELI|nr:D-2-hydroxyacid dehydrogenase [Helicobacter saguini]MWV61177.1 D-2-hydroxyacid dehydrogenase [Helicobacter saguini]MWV68156.1 D-2-hydroxyacid dehydrogenase [Helicobacter saguini]MWV70381.1 D-2-hydroxyacid dehydrogenase [Helicobacter saguini]MWV72282.1 D-2-hydroxyacid dehydrogenase [Helicobacter saguini]TLD95321.1 D-2-hydroxyacid dehydrogenase [Helicobacter saguini]
MKIVMLDRATLGEFDSKIFEKFGEFVSYPVTKSNEIIERSKDAEIIITNKVVLNAETLEKLPKLKLICITATGTNNIDLVAAKRLNIAVKNVAGYSTFAVAQHTLALALNFLGEMPYYTHYVARGEWAKSEIFCHLERELHDLYAKSWGIIGYGAIGKRVCALAQAFGADVSYHSTSGHIRKENVPHKSLDAMLAECDIISIHAPFNEQTNNLITLDSIKKLKKGAILLNLGRGGIVNESDVAAALKGGQDFYFGADVLKHEPMESNNPLLEIMADSKLSRRILITPHIAWAYKDTKNVLLKKVAGNIESFLNA